MDYTNLYSTTYGTDGTVGAYNPDTNTYDYDPNNLPDDEVGFRTVGVARIGIELRLPTGDTVLVNPDDYITEMVIENPDHTVFSLAGRLRTVCGSSRFQNFMPQFYNPTGPQLSDYILPQMLVIDSSEAHRSKLNYVPIFSILSVGDIQSADTLGVTVVGPGAQYAPLDTVIDNAKDGDIIELLSGDYTVDLTITKSLTIQARGIAKLHGRIAVGSAEKADEKLEVKFLGLDFTENATITVDHATSFIMDNCEFYDLDSLEPKASVIRFTEDSECFVDISNNTFKANNGAITHVIDIYPKITENSKIDNNRFEGVCCDQDTIVLYGLARNGDVEVNDNFCEISRNMLHIGFRGVVNGRIEVERNSYNETDTDTTYAGLVMVEPCGMLTESMNMLDISITDTRNNSGIPQLVYLYSGPEDMRFDNGTRPKIYIDGYYKDVPYIIVNEDNDTEVGDVIGADEIVTDNPKESADEVNPGTVVFDDTGSELNL